MAGTYTDIVEIIAPSEAAYGDLVAVEVKVRNTWTGSSYIAITGSYDEIGIPFEPEYATVEPGATYSFTGSFYMPNWGLRLHIWSWYWMGTEWSQDDYGYVDIALAAPPEVYTGELVIAYILWEGKEGWNQIVETNTWPPDTETTTTWKVKNTGDESAYFKVSFMGLESAGVLLNPGEEATLYLYPVTPSPGSYDYTLEVIADDQVVSEYPVQVVTGEVPEPEFASFNITEYQKV